MAWKEKKVYVLTAWYANFEESGYDYPSTEFYADTMEEAECRKVALMESGEYEDVWIGNEKEEREFLV